MSRVLDIFSLGGPLHSALPGYTLRQSQLRMAEAVERAIREDGVLLAEAGTGTGKTLAYLVPVILSELTAVVSTGTKNLQEQVFFKDIAFLEEALGQAIDAVYLKGQDNYLCKRRLADFLRSPAVLAYPSVQVRALTEWAAETDIGDRMELTALGDDDPLFREVCSTRETRIGARCPFFNECFVTVARKAAMRARIVVVNHHLYFADVATRLKGGTLLPSHDILVLDEAHAVEDVATEFFSTKISSGRIDRLIRDAMRAVNGARLTDDPARDRRPKLERKARAAGAQLFDLLRGPLGKDRLVPEELGSAHVDAYFRLDSSLDALESSLRLLEGRNETVDHTAMRFREIRDDLAFVLTESTSGHVNWVENRTRSVTVGASPIDVCEPIRNGVLFTVPKVVMTSATLSTGGDFGYLKSRMGIDFDVRELTVSSPFDYRAQACLYIPGDLPDPRTPEFPEAAAARAEALVALTGGGALILCTSHANMKHIHRALKGRVPGRLLLQGEAPKSSLLDAFAKRRDSVLVATASFWQGVDLPGESLRLVIIDKLPFQSPSEPLEAARIVHLNESGAKAFIEYQVPRAALQLKQGVGRLIRTERDRGVVAILDGRLRSARYAGIFLRSLPDCSNVSDLSAVARWLGETGDSRMAGVKK